MNKHIKCFCSLALFNAQVSVGTLILSSFIGSCIGDCQPRAEKSWSTAVTGGDATACARDGPLQVLSTSARRKHTHGYKAYIMRHWMDGAHWRASYLHVSSKLSDLFIRWVPWMLSVGGSGINRSSIAVGPTDMKESKHIIADGIRLHSLTNICQYCLQQFTEEVRRLYPREK